MSVRVSGGFGNEWDNYNANGRFAVLLTQNLLNNLTILDPVDGSNIRPDLAESWTITPDGKTITYNIRKGVAWHDGKPLTSKDIAFSLNRARNPETPAAGFHRSRVAVITDIQTPDDSTVIVTLARPSASFLTVVSVANLTIYPAHLAPIDTWKATPTGTGPFKYKSLVRDASAEFVRNDSYFKMDERGQALPYLDGLSFTWITDQALAFSAFRTGRLSCACGYSSDILVSQRKEAEDAIKGVKFGTSWSVNFLFFNTARAPFNNLKFRQAVNVGFDRGAMRDVLRGGTGFYPPTYFVPKEIGGRFSLSKDDLLKVPGFREPKTPDTDLAKQLLKDSGIDLSKTTIALVTNATQKDVSEALVSLLLPLGINVKLELVPSTPDLTARMLRGDFDLNYTGGGNSFDDPADIVTNYVLTGAGLNYGKVSDAKLDQLLNDQDAQLDAAKRVQLLGDLQRTLLDLAAFVPIHTFPQLYAVQPFVEGFILDRAFTVGPAHRFERVWFNR